MAKATAKGNETPRQTFRLPPVVSDRLGELAADGAAQSGMPPNKTAVLVGLINAEYSRRGLPRKGPRKKSPNPS